MFRYQISTGCTILHACKLCWRWKITDSLESIEYNYVKDHMQDYRRRTPIIWIWSKSPKNIYWMIVVLLVEEFLWEKWSEKCKKRGEGCNQGKPKFSAPRCPTILCHVKPNQILQQHSIFSTSCTTLFRDILIHPLPWCTLSMIIIICYRRHP